MTIRIYLHNPAYEWQRSELNCTFSGIIKNFTVVEVADRGSDVAWLQRTFPGVASPGQVCHYVLIFI
jgi:hypothetical protein